MCFTGVCKKRKDNWTFAGLSALGLATLLVVPSAATAQQDPLNLRPIMIGVGGMLTPAIDQGYRGGWDLLGGGGVAVTRWSHHRRWRLYATGNFMFAHLGVTNWAINQAKSANAMNTAFEGVLGAKARFYSATFDPTVRIELPRGFSFYLLGGFGWFKRSVDFTGDANQGILIEPAAPSVLKPSCNSAAVDGGAGLNHLLHGQRSAMVFVEARYLHGLGGNRATSLMPVSVGIRW
ncbi:MAG: hypothetical protein ACLP59_34095 [Bryobacteraceae bacterium]